MAFNRTNGVELNTVITWHYSSCTTAGCRVACAMVTDGGATQSRIPKLNLVRPIEVGDGASLENLSGLIVLKVAYHQYSYSRDIPSKFNAFYASYLSYRDRL